MVDTGNKCYFGAVYVNQETGKIRSKTSKKMEDIEGVIVAKKTLYVRVSEIIKTKKRRTLKKIIQAIKQG